METLTIAFDYSITAVNGGLAKSRGFGIHPDRVWDSYELIFVKEGTLYIAEEERDFSVGANETLLLWPGKRHRGLQEYETNLSFFWAHFQIADPPSRLMNSALSIPQYMRVKRPDHLTALFRRFLDDQESIGVTGLAGGLLIALMLCEIKHSTEAAQEEHPASILLASQANEIIQTKMHENLSTSYLATMLSCNPDYLGRIFRQVHGITLTDAIHKYRMIQARKLLLETNLTIGDVARRCGFHDMSYFRRVFRRWEGMNPRAYRQMFAHRVVNTE
ncbi:MAG: AraC family transcriptional regulator [Chloroflexota bacterium]|nr:AraC family transcriptional regulator [Chloroflexota bacterium]